MEEYFKTLDMLIMKTQKMLENLTNICLDEDITDLNPQQICILCKMIPSKEYNVKNLDEVYSLSNISYNLKSLHKYSYIEKINSPSDDRKKIVKMTAKGESVCHIFKKKLSEGNLEKLYKQYLIPMPLNQWENSTGSLEQPNTLKQVPSKTINYTEVPF